MTYTEQQISDLTGFDVGDKFTSEKQVRDYFTPESMAFMFGGTGGSNPALELTGEELTEMAELVVENGWHMADGDD